MMTRTPLFGSGSSFAHLNGIATALGVGRRVRAEDPPKDDPAAEDPKDDPAAEDPKDDPAAEDPKDDPAAEDPKDDPAAEDPKDDPACEDDDDEEEMKGKGAAAQARGRERARCAAIFGQPEAGINPALAASLAFETSLPRKQAIAVLKSQAGSGAVRAPSADRRAGNPDLGTGGGERRPGSQAAIDASWDRAIAKAGPRSRK